MTISPAKKYTRDVLAGLTVASVGLPPCLAFSMMIGLRPAHGLVTAAVPGAVAAVFGRSAQVITGPTNTTSLLVLATLAPLLDESGVLSPAGLPTVASLALLAGLFRVLFALAGGSAIVRFLPESVLVGFTAGAAVLICVMQLDEALGLRGVHGAGLLSQLGAVAGLIWEGHPPALPAVAIASITVAAILLGRRYAPHVPIAVVLVLATTAGAWLLSLDASVGLPIVADRSPVPRGWPTVALPTLDIKRLSDLLFPALAIALLGTLELLVCARAERARPDMRRELMTQGLANVAGAFTGAFPASASLSRSALLRQSGNRTRIGSLVAALAIIPVLLFVPHTIDFIPLSVLAGVLLATAVEMIKIRRLRRMWRAATQTRLLLAVTLLSTLLMPLEWAIISGTGLALVMHLAATMQPRTRLLIPRGDGRLTPLRDGERPSIAVLEVSGDLHFAAATTFADDARELVPDSAERVIVDLSHAHQARYASLDKLEDLDEWFAEQGQRLELAGVPPAFVKLLDKTHSSLPYVPADPEPGASVRRALEQRVDADKT